MQEHFRLFLIMVCISFVLVPVTVHAQNEPDPSEHNESDDESDERRVRRLGDTTAEDFELDLSIPSAPAGSQTSSPQVVLPDEDQNRQLQDLLSGLASNPRDRALNDSLDKLLDAVILEARQFALEGDIEGSVLRLNAVQQINPEKAGLAQARQYLKDLESIDQRLNDAAAALAAGELLDPPRANALFHYEQVLEIDPQNEDATMGLRMVQQGLVDQALVSAREFDFETAEELLFEASQVRQPQDLVDGARQEIATFQMQQAARIGKQVEDAIEQSNFDYADFLLIDLIAMTGNTDEVTRLRKKLQNARVYGNYTPGQVIQDEFINGSQRAPAVVVIKPGSFVMGSPESEEGRSANEGPQHRVTIAQGFAIGLQEITVGQFREFIELNRYRTDAQRLGESRVYDEVSGRISLRPNINWAHDYEGNRARDNDPVLHVTWQDAQAYVRWLSEATRKRYRLPTEAEFEYAIRAGTMTRFWWGDDRPDQAVENLTGTQDRSVNGRAWTSGFRRYDDGFWGPAPGASFPPNPWGLHDMAGNVSEWVEDCWHETFTRAPDDGSAWVNPGCSRRVIRGGYWASAPEQSRSASRLSAGVRLTGPRVGFRIARDL